MSAQFSQPHLCGWRFSRSDGKGAVAAALVLSNLLPRTCGRGFRLERVRDCANESTPRLFGFGLMNAAPSASAIGHSENIGASAIGTHVEDHVKLEACEGVCVNLKQDHTRLTTQYMFENWYDTFDELGHVFPVTFGAAVRGIGGMPDR